ncbi:MAG: hypothetical protein F4213_00545 [Boseongicola sp. SB0677_bin_26]|nr:hypothetical protein [Boseongicola sp. SB0665_bin_10]MYG24502.1 hypothetical protein [Boseongicola sp. SB0677_bin_26]
MDALRAQLERAPNIQITAVRQAQRLAPGCRLDAWIEFDRNEDRYGLLIEIKPDGAPRFARSAIYQRESCIPCLHRWRPSWP